MGVGRKVDVCLGCFAGENVEGGVDGDFEVAAFCGVSFIDLGEAENDLRLLIWMLTCIGCECLP